MIMLLTPSDHYFRNYGCLNTWKRDRKMFYACVNVHEYMCVNVHEYMCVYVHKYMCVYVKYMCV